MKKKVTNRRKKRTTNYTSDDKALVREIKKLHSDIMGFYKKSVEAGIKLGGLLQKKKKTLCHGEWLPWLKQNFDFTAHTATNYMGLFTHRVEIREAKVKDLQDAYKLISSLNNYTRHNKRAETKKRRKEFADRNIKFRNPKSYINSVLCGDNYDLMKKMIANGMAGMYSMVCTSPPYNASFFYGKCYNDDKPYKEYLKDILKVFPLYTKLLRRGGRIVYIVSDIVKNKDRDKGGDYNHSLVTNLINGVHEVSSELLLYNKLTWEKSARKDPLNKQYGTYCSPKRPLTRSCTEHILVWSVGQYDLEDIEGYGPDITPEEFEEWSWDVWKVSPYSHPNNPHPCSFPPKLIERVLKFYSWPNDLVLDPYAGVSTTAQVCVKLNRRHTMLELNPNFCTESERLLQTA